MIEHLPLISADRIRELVADRAVDIVTDALRAFSTGTVSVSVRGEVTTHEPEGRVLSMGAHIAGDRYAAFKLVSVYMGNTELPSHQGLICAFDATSGQPAAVLDATYLTGLRTAAVSAASVRLLAREDADTLAILGTGEQAFAHAVCLAREGRFSRIAVAGRSVARATALVERCRAVGVDARACRTFEEACAGAGVVIGATHSREPVVRRDWLAPGVHVASVGVTHDGQEVDRHALAAAEVVAVESRATAARPPPLGSNEVARAVADGSLGAGRLVELGELAGSGGRPGRTRRDSITVFKSVGSAAADAALTSAVLAGIR